MSVKVAVLGAGTVGSEVIRLLQSGAADLTARIGAPLELVKVAARSVDPSVSLPDGVYTTDLDAAVNAADVVVELMGGIEPARTAILSALAAGKGVVTANKALLAAHGPELYAAAEASGADLYFEAAVAGAIPLLRPIRESLTGDHITSVMGIVNGTTNYILDQMTTAGTSFDEALATAQELGFAEADPSADVDGDDAAAKAAILAALAFHTRVRMDDVAVEGIRGVTSADIEAAAFTDHVIKLLAVAKVVDGAVTVAVRPTFVPLTHPLASVAGSFNAVFVQAEAAGDLMFYGRGAGGTPTASAVLGDVVSVARHIVHGGRGPRESAYRSLAIADPATVRTQAVLRLAVVDKPGVLAAVASVLAGHGVSISTVHQFAADADADLLIITHETSERDLAAVAAELNTLDVVNEVASIFRIEGA